MDAIVKLSQAPQDDTQFNTRDLDKSIVLEKSAEEHEPSMIPTISIQSLKMGGFEHDPLAALTAPPEGETSEDRVRRERKEQEAQKISDQIDHELKAERALLKKSKGMVKVLLLGQSESGMCYEIFYIIISLNFTCSFRKVYYTEEYVALFCFTISV